MSQHHRRFGWPAAIAASALILWIAFFASAQRKPSSDAVARLSAGRYFAQPFVTVGDTSPGAEESQLLLEMLEEWKTSRTTNALAGLEEFVQKLSNSPWGPSLHANLGAHWRSRGQVTRALAHWEAAWEATKEFPSGNGKQVGDFALANWTRLLVLLGRTEDLTAIYQAYGHRVLDRGPLSQMWLRTREKHLRMQKYEADSYKCGIYALAQVAQALHLKYQRGQFLRTPSKGAGFTLQELQVLADQYAVGLRAVRRAEGSGQLVVPSVVHLRQEHYTAIIGQRGELYRVADPSGLGVLWLTAAEINTEASGYFLVPRNDRSDNFASVGSAEAGLIFGRHGSCPPEDWEDLPCSLGDGGGGTGVGGSAGSGSGGTDSGDGSGFGDWVQAAGWAADCLGCGGGGSGSGGGDGDECCEEAGLPKWRVSEPYLNIWMTDVPTRYLPAKGPPVVLKLRYKQRNEDIYCGGWGLPEVAGNWNCNWFSFAYPSEGGAKVVLPGGGELMYEFPENSNLSERQYRNNSQLEALFDDDVLVGYLLHFPDGRQLRYTNSYASGWEFQLSEQIDPQGNKLTFNYDGTLVSSITDADGNDTLLYYTNQVLLTRVTTPDGREVQLSHDQYGQLTNIVDAAGLSSWLSYPAAGWYYGPTSLTTPYGTTHFDVTGTFSAVDRSVIITEPDGSRHAFALWHLNTNVPTGFAAAQLPTNTPFATGGYPYGTLDVTNRHERNTFYWNAQQFAALGTTNFADFTWTELKRARIRHWLGKFSPDSDNHVDTLGHEQAPSANGTEEGRLTWYDYDGKDYDAPELRGEQVLPAVIARVMPDGSTAYQSFARLTNGRPTKAVDKWAAGHTSFYRTNTYVYAANNLDLTLHLGPAGTQVSSNRYNGYHQVVTNYDAFNQETRYTYDGTTHLITSVSRPSGLITTNTHNGSHRLQTTTHLPINRSESFTWGTDGNVKSITDARGLTITNYWDGLNRLIGTRYPDGTGTTNLYTVGSAYPGGSGGTGILDLTATKDRLGHWTYFGCDALRRRLAETNANGAITRYGYCDCGAVSYLTNAWASAVQLPTWFEFDYQGHRTKTHHPDAVVTNAYDSLGRLTSACDAWGRRTFGYHNLSRLTSISNAFGAEQLTTYDPEDRPIYVTDANHVTITNTYDELGRLRTRTAPDGGAEKFGYSARGLIAYTNQIGATNFYAYDEAGRKTYETNANWEIIQYRYDPSGNLTNLIDGKLQSTVWKYDEYGRVTNKLDQAGVEILRYKYDQDNRLTNRWSIAKTNAYYQYDPVGNLTNIDYAVSSDVRFEYDALNRVTKMVDAAGTNTYSYALGGQLWTEDGPWTSDTVTNSYSNRLRTGLSLAQPTGSWTNGFRYDGAKRLTNVTSQAGAFDYYLGAVAAASPLAKKISLPNTSYITNTYDTVARLTGTHLKTSGHVLTNKHEYTYNAANQRLRQTFMDGATSDYYYDRIGQLTNADSSVAAQDRKYVYDAAWNLNYRTNNTTAYVFLVDGKNQLMNGPGGGFRYDANGNLLQATNAFYWYAYDDENRLANIYYYQAGDGNGNPTSYEDYPTEFAYDGNGRLRKRVDYTSSASPPYTWVSLGENRYIYDGMRVIQERSSANTPLVSYTRGTDLSGGLTGAGGIGGLLGRSHAYQTGSGNFTNHNYYQADGNGNITYMLNSSQSKVAEYRYDPFGNTISSSGTLATANVYRFSSKEYYSFYGANTIYYYGYRFYDPSLQRWVNRDPIGDQVGLSEFIRIHPELASGLRDRAFAHLYDFTYNNPVSFVDSDGRPVVIAVPVGAVLVGGSVLVCLAIPACRANLDRLLRDLSREMARCLPRAIPKPTHPEQCPKEVDEVLPNGTRHCVFYCRSSGVRVNRFDSDCDKSSIKYPESLPGTDPVPPYPPLPPQH